MDRYTAAAGCDNHFVLLYRNPELCGTFRDKENVREVVLKAPNIFLWDQVAARWAEREEKFDVIFNPKYSISLTAKCKTAYVNHGLNWAVLSLPKVWTDYFSHSVLRPRNAHKADAIIAVSNTTRQNLIDYLGADENRVHTVYHGVDSIFSIPVSE